MPSGAKSGKAAITLDEARRLIDLIWVIDKRFPKPSLMEQIEKKGFLSKRQLDWIERTARRHRFSVRKTPE